MTHREMAARLSRHLPTPAVRRARCTGLSNPKKAACCWKSTISIRFDRSQRPALTLSRQSGLTAGGRGRRRLILVAQPQPVHRVRQALFVTTERRQVEIVIGGVHHVEAARKTGIGVKYLTCLIAVKYADAWRVLDTEAGGPEIIDLGTRFDFGRRE